MNKWMAGVAMSLVLVLGLSVLHPIFGSLSALAADPIGRLDPVPSAPNRYAITRRSGRPKPRTGAAAQKLARDRFNIFAETIRSLDPADANLDGPYYTVPRYAGYPGLCAADAIWINPREQPAIHTRTVFRVVGDLNAPMPDPDPAKNRASARYEFRARSNCANRTASNDWFPGESPQETWNEVQLFDNLIAAARSWRPLSFQLRCVGFGPASPVCANIRSFFATLNPHDIRSITESTEWQDGVIRSTIDISLHGLRPPMLIVIKKIVPYGPVSESKMARTQVELTELLPPPT